MDYQYGWHVREHVSSHFSYSETKRTRLPILIIPIDIWVPLGYPTDSLKSRMVSNDEETMSIKLSHLYVDARVGGLVDMSYMHT
ncbi:hypothetical protein ACE6H2_000670 [Prunus campanulata]